MQNKLIRNGVFLTLVLFLAAACASSQAVCTGGDRRAIPGHQRASAPPRRRRSIRLSPRPAQRPHPTRPRLAQGGSGSTRYELVPDKSEARYRVREQLANVSLPSDAVGKTKQITGAIVLKTDGTVDSSQSKFVVDLSTLQSDRGMRDNFLRRNVLQTNQYPNAVFVPTAVTGLPASLPQSGPVSFQVTGDLTVRDVTRPVTWDVTGSIENGQAAGTATTSFTFSDFSLQQPRVPVVLSVEDTIKLEVDIALQPATQ